MASRRGRAVYADSRWRRVRRLALDRARGRCERCGGAYSRLEVHHLDPVASRGGAPVEADYDLSRLAVWCRPCHFAATAEANRRPASCPEWAELVRELMDAPAGAC